MPRKPYPGDLAEAEWGILAPLRHLARGRDRG